MKRSQLLLLILILALAFFSRTYKFVDRLDFGLDHDLYSWIVKDIVVNKHLRLVGQETTASGVFIGPLFYYVLVPFFLMLKMDPVAPVIPVTILGLLAVLSYYLVFSKLFNTKVGLIASFLYAVLLSTAVSLDRRLVPSTPTNIWTIWYFFTVVMLARGRFHLLPLLAILISLIWHIHIALAPALIAIPFAILLSKKLPNIRQMIIFFVVLLISSLPLIIFELKHGFGQTLSLLDNLTTSRPGPSGWYKFQVVKDMITKNINSLFFAPLSFKLTNHFLFPLMLLASAFLFIKRKILTLREVIPLYIWIGSVVLFFSISSSPISEYYFTSIEVIFLCFVSLLFYLLYQSSAYGKFFVITILTIIALKNAHYLITQGTYHKGYNEKKAVVDYIIKDSKDKGFPCFSINYITSPGENVGFRYFFFLKNAHIAVAGRGSPVYNIVIPDEYSEEVKVKFGHIGIIPPKEIPPKDVMIDACSGQNTNLTDPMFGYVE